MSVGQFSPDNHFPYIFGLFESNKGRIWENLPECFIALDIVPVFIYCLSHITVINRWVMGCAEDKRVFPCLFVYEPVGIG